MKQPLAWIIFIFLALTWGSSFILIKKGLVAFDPVQVGALRVLIAALVLQPFLWGKAKQVPRKKWWPIIIVGIIGNGIPAYLFPAAQAHINSATAGVLNSLSPLFVLLFGLLFFGMSISNRQIIGVILGFIGALLLTLAKGGEIDPFDNLMYSGLIVLATICYGIAPNVMKRYLTDMNSVLATGFALTFAAIPYTLYLLTISGIPEVMQTHPQAWSSLGFLVILGAIGTALAVVLFYRLIQLTDAVMAASVTYLIPLVALGWGLIDGESFSLPQLAGIFVILVGVYLVNKK
ncbi:MAG: DMT family transporter [Bacteroidota bacterium]